ncbi:hypothetical protein BDZ91DRAFT_719793 [Kalaharituber pfeilii]|nr:hypothetical protein BDZ91DRAFT_719793 [Kalaharituber pfeilii]
MAIASLQAVPVRRTPLLLTFLISHRPIRLFVPPISKGIPFTMTTVNPYEGITSVSFDEAMGDLRTSTPILERDVYSSSSSQYSSSFASHDEIPIHNGIWNQASLGNQAACYDCLDYSRRTHSERRYGVSLFETGVSPLTDATILPPAYARSPMQPAASSTPRSRGHFGLPSPEPSSSTQAHDPPNYWHHRAPLPFVYSILDSPSQSRFSLDDGDCGVIRSGSSGGFGPDIVTHLSVIRGRNRNKCTACGGNSETGDATCRCPFSLKHWVSTTFSRIDKKLKINHGSGISIDKNNCRPQTTEGRNIPPVPPAPPNTPAAQDSNKHRSSKFDDKRSAAEGDLEIVSGRKCTRVRSKGHEHRLDLKNVLISRSIAIEPGLDGTYYAPPRHSIGEDVWRSGVINPRRGGRVTSHYENGEGEVGKWFGQWKRGVRKVVAIGKIRGI